MADAGRVQDRQQAGVAPRAATRRQEGWAQAGDVGAAAVLQPALQHHVLQQGILGFGQPCGVPGAGGQGGIARLQDLGAEDGRNAFHGQAAANVLGGQQRIGVVARRERFQRSRQQCIVPQAGRARGEEKGGGAPFWVLHGACFMRGCRRRRS